MTGVGARGPGAFERWRLRAALALVPLLCLALVATLAIERRASGGEAERLDALVGAWERAEAAALGAGPEAVPPARSLLEVDRRLDALRAVSGALPPGWLAPALAIGALLASLWLALELSRRRASELVRHDGRDRHRQSAILRLLDEMAPLADGDLRVRATVDESMTGALADAFNHAVGELARLARSAADSAHRVHAAVDASRRSARSLSAGAAVQAREILRSSNYLNAMSGAMSTLSANAAESAAVAGRARVEVAAGREGVARTTAELARIRDEASMTRRLMHRLEENARAIDREVERTVDLARRTDLLALNTTLRANGESALRVVGRAAAAGGARGAVGPAAGEVDRAGDWARLSDEVSELAAALGESSREIADMTAVIRDDAVETLRSMSAMDAAFERGVESADAAVGALGAIESTVTDLDALIGDTATKAVRQSGVVRRLSGNMGVIHRLSRDGVVSIEAAARALDDLKRLADELERSVAGFRS